LVHATHKVLFVYGEYSGLAQRTHRRHANLALKDGHFPEELSRTPNDPAWISTILLQDDLDLPLLNDEHAVSYLALADDDFTILVHLS
jgi:hypothetical protein